MADKYTFDAKTKKWTTGLMIVGVVGLLLGVLGIVLNPGHGWVDRLWSNILLNGYYFMGISIGALFFVSAHQLGYGGWITQIKRIPETMGAFIPVAGGILLLVIAGSWGHLHELYHHWTHPHADDFIVAEKLPYLNLPFFTIRVLIYIVGWTVFSMLIRRISNTIAVDAWKRYLTHKRLACGYLVFFAVSESMASWDLVMSLEPHWYSTLFGWYNLASYTCGALAFILIFIGILKKQGYLPSVTEDHVHDVAKFMFGFSVFYTYLWFSQFLLIWYGNVPEDTAYYMLRWETPLFNVLFYVTLVVNFVVPLLFLMSRESKRNWNRVIAISIIVIFGHYLDFYVQIMPGPNQVEEGHGHHEDAHAMNNVESVYTLAEHHEEDVQEHSHEHEHNGEVHDHGHADHHEGDHAAAAHHDGHGHDDHGDGHHWPATHAGLGFVELFIFLGFAGAFCFVFFNALTKVSIVPEQDPYIEESKHHHI